MHGSFHHRGMRTPNKCEWPHWKEYMQMIHKRHLLLVPGRSSVPVSSYACLWIANYETGHTLPSSSSWEVARHWERAGGGKKGRGEITSNSSTRILRHWVKKQLLWSSISQERGGLGCGSAEGHRTTLAELWVCEDDMGDERICYFAERDANVMLVMCLSLLGTVDRFVCLCCGLAVTIHRVEGCYVIVFWKNSYSDPLELSRRRAFFEILVILCQNLALSYLHLFFFFLVWPVYIWVKRLSITSSFILILFFFFYLPLYPIRWYNSLQ